MSWDPFQREVLAELGLVVYRQAGGAIERGAEVVRIDAPAAEVESMTHAMLARVARAAGMSPEALQVRIDDMQLIASLHGNASAKRALWPGLRAMRRQSS